MKNFAMIGAAGYIAPRHLQAIKDTGNSLLAAMDKFDSVGIMDSYFPHADFFTEFERFDRHIEKLRRMGKVLDYVSICSPNYLHDSHIRFALRHHAHAICEKPLVLNPWNVDALADIEKETGKKVYTILQLRLHPNIIQLKKEIDAAPADKVFDVNLTYITSRGKWYHHSWKGDEAKSGGIATNIGIHFFDMLLWVFGEKKSVKMTSYETDKASGIIELKKARVNWMLSINENDLPAEAKAKGKRTFRSLKMNGNEIEFSDGFTELHTKSYSEILAGRGFGLNDARPSIELAHEIRLKRN
ncbi:MAG TPA: Gfo/Idh/MocA family oxidoreductase [Cyclobacteriaceae bacterium]|jgi:UDP-N-acetyl-2-amino-2-deoxyglucuronate dehydrogenase|nr:Gfo/Idh/MocA family oxidoreductase [Cyclobacteriaceae bacterium]